MSVATARTGERPITYPKTLLVAARISLLTLPNREIISIRAFRDSRSAPSAFPSTIMRTICAMTSIGTL